MVETPTVSASDLAAASPAGRTSDLLLIEVAKLQSDGEYLRRDIGEVRSDIREIRSEVKDIRAEFRTETQGIRSEMKEMRGEFRGEILSVRGEIGGIGERVTRLEERVAHLPGKGFIVAVVSTALVLVGAATTIMPRLQAMSAPPVIQSPQSAPR
jgi:uncharacterized protein (DUF3084 family)